MNCLRCNQVHTQEHPLTLTDTGFFCPTCLDAQAISCERTSHDEPVSDELPLFNVKDYGAVGDGITDDSVAIQTAINAARSYRGTASHVAVLLEPGIHISLPLLESEPSP